MASDRFRTTVGAFECLIIQDSTSTGTVDRLFSNVDAVTAQAALPDGRDSIEISYNVCAIFSDDWVLIDTGNGDSGRLGAVLDDEDIRPEHIIVTHAHRDHFGGLLTDDGDENFPNTPVYMCQNEWMWFTSSEYADDNPERAAFIKENLVPAEHQIERLECADVSDILPGLSVITLPGHTPHHIGIMVASGDERLIIAGDTLLHPLHLEHLDWQFPNDSDHSRARESRIKLAELAIQTGAQVLNYHFPFPGLGHIERADDEDYRWVPVDANA